MKKYVKISLDNILEKVSSVEAISDKEIEAMAYVINKKAADKEREYFNKLAAEDKKSEPTREELDKLKSYSNLKFQDIDGIKNGEFIVFPEIKDNEALVTPAIVFKDITLLGDKIYAIVIAIDGRYKVMKVKENFLCIKSDRGFKINKVHIDTLHEGDTFITIDKNNVYSPLRINYIDKIEERNRSTNSIDTYGTMISAKEVNRPESEESKYSVLPISEAKTGVISKEDAIKMLAERNLKSVDHIRRCMHWSTKDIFVLNSDKGVIQLIDEITTNMKDKSEFDLKSDLNNARISLSNEKVAFSNNTIILECIDRKGALYNLNIEYRDTDERLMNLRTQKFNRIREGKVRAILRILKFDGRRINEIIYKSKNEPRCISSMPAETKIEDIKKIQQGDMVNVSLENLKKNIKVYADPADIVKNMALTGALGLAASAAMDVSPGVLGPRARAVSGIISKMAKESANLSSGYEKIASEYENEYLLDIAKVAAIGSIYFEKLANVIDDTENAYPSIGDISREIKYLKPIMEKMAFDLVSIKVKQADCEEYVIEPGMLSSTVKVFDNLFKTASAVSRSLNIDKLKLS